MRNIFQGPSHVLIGHPCENRLGDTPGRPPILKKIGRYSQRPIGGQTVGPRGRFQERTIHFSTSFSAAPKASVPRPRRQGAGNHPAALDRPPGMTPAPPEPPSSTPPSWPHCGHDAAQADPVGCRGIHVGDHTACLAHLSEADRAAYLATLSPGTSIDHRGTPFTTELLHQLLAALRSPTTGLPLIGDARFGGTSFSGDAWFGGTSFSGDAEFSRASFSRDAWFSEASFSGVAWFDGASFSSDAGFDRASFSGFAQFGEASFSGVAGFNGASFSRAQFGEATFSGTARFDGAAFSDDAWFGGTSFSGDAQFHGAAFSGDARFNKARFELTSGMGPLVCGKRVVLDTAVFQQPVTLEIAARQVSCARTRWASTAMLHLRYAELDLRDAVFEYPVLIAARPTPFPLSSSTGLLPETKLFGLEPGVHLATVGGVDAAHLALHDIDLSRCRFAGAVHLDQLKVDGWCTFATTPTGRYGRSPWRWSPRRTLIEEHHWRVQSRHRPDQPRGWTRPPEDAAVLQPAALAALYRQLRKSLEDGKNEPDAADFYYGECEMRRHDATRPWAERTLLTAYCTLSGYGLRATRALAWLAAAMAATVAVMVLWGLPAEDPKPTITGRQVAAGQEVAWTTDTPDPVNPTGPWSERVTTERFDKALRVVINSVVFRSSGQDLTTVGTYTEMASRLVEPVLLGLAVLAVRSRVKR
ncbi:pentapeptide repeat-containing protein [Streptomyces sp. TRM 70351]|uniref:pentapeptide repeat-containing protein n=1 Tax=Streptomyces sp. TRM 70351 TaxID=3116552 RepID=UPI002E7AFEF2|nr:pentapeptide repeat-containing protein [Streptomyces sp. TRM 70351]MEE1931267.1 pentapeptide repeat-containing protein [Streptomyces sp. TRM 70351]